LELLEAYQVSVLSESFNISSNSSQCDYESDEKKTAQPIIFKEENIDMLSEMSINLEQVVRENMAKKQIFILDEY
jgi:hypothetical protein